MEELKKQFAGYYDYFDDIRQRIYGLAVIFVMFFVVGFAFSGQILKIIINFFQLDNVSIVITSPFQFLDLAMSIGVYVAFIACLPLFIYHLYAFLKDGLYKKERKIFFLLLPIGFLLFLIGFGYGFSVLYFTLDSIAAINLTLGVQNLWDINKFLSQIILTSALLGFIFQFPIVLTFLLKARIIDANFLRQKRRHAVIIMFILTAFLPPTDGLSLIIMVFPLLLIYEGTLLVNTFFPSRNLINLPN